MPRVLHTMLRVGDLARSVAFYRDALGMHVLRTSDRPEHKSHFYGLWSRVGDRGAGADVQLRG